MDKESHAAPFILSCAYFTYENIEFRSFHLAYCSRVSDFSEKFKCVSYTFIVLVTSITQSSKLSVRDRYDHSRHIYFAKKPIQWQ